MGTKINALPQVVTPVGTDELPISQDTGSGSRITYKATLDQIKNYVKNTGGGTGSVTSVGVNSTDGSISVFGSPVVGAGTITLNISSVGLDKLDDGGATNGQVLTYNGSTTTWVASAVPKELPSTATTGQVLTYNGSTSTWVASAAIGTTLLSSNGYITLSNGLIMQWGSVSCGISDSASATFPITFPTTVYILVSTPQSMGTSGQTGDGVSNKTTSGFTQYNGAGTARVFNWYAIGV